MDADALTHRYGSATVLDAVDLHVARGSRHAIVGANGAGKTTLLGLIAGSGPPTAGRIRFDGRDVTGLTQHRRANLGVGRAWQRPAVIESFTAVDNIALALRGTRLRSARRSAMHLLEQAGLGRHGDTPTAHLAHGQRRTVELLTALAGKPRLLILDEPSAGLLDVEVVDLLNRLLLISEETTLLLTDHSMTLISAVADTVTLLDDGKHVQTGPSASVLPHLPGSEVAARSPAESTTTAPASSRPGRPRLDVSGLEAGYGGHHVLRGVELTVFPCEIIAIIGGDGSGRTTLVNTLAGVHPAHPNARIALDGADLTGLPAAQRARAGLTTVLQATLPIPQITVVDQLRLSGLDLDTADEALAVAPWIGSRAHQRVATLSGGERQSLMVACALARRSSVLLLDEPAEGMAGPLVDRLRASLRRTAARQTAILLTTTPSSPLLDIADHVLKLNNGRLHGT